MIPEKYLAESLAHRESSGNGSYYHGIGRSLCSALIVNSEGRN